jgi:hypothetical protein
MGRGGRWREPKFTDGLNLFFTLEGEKMKVVKLLVLVLFILVTGQISESADGW